MGLKWLLTDFNDIINIDEVTNNKIIHKLDTLVFLNNKLSETQHIFFIFTYYYRFLITYTITTSKLSIICI